MSVVEGAKGAVTGVTVVTPESTFSVRTVNVFSTNNQPNQADISQSKILWFVWFFVPLHKITKRMKREITARSLLAIIRKSSFGNATPTDVLTMSIVELAERTTAASIYLDGLGWLIGQFWEDKERDEEYLVAEKIYHTAEFCSALYHHHAFDLNVLGEGAPTGSFEYANTALMEWIQHAEHRRVAALVCRIVLDAELDKAVRDNQAVQDYYAEHVYGTHSDNWQLVDDCEKFIQRAIEGMGVVAHHYEEARKWGLEGEAVQVNDMVYGWVPHVFEEEVVATAREILEAANRLLPDELTLRNDAGARAYIKNVFKEAQQIAEKYDVDLDIHDGYSLTIGYMETWLERKYWGDREEEDEE